MITRRTDCNFVGAGAQFMAAQRCGGHRLPIDPHVCRGFRGGSEAQVARQFYQWKQKILVLEVGNQQLGGKFLIAGKAGHHLVAARMEQPAFPDFEWHQRSLHGHLLGRRIKENLDRAGAEQIPGDSDNQHQQGRGDSAQPGDSGGPTAGDATSGLELNRGDDLVRAFPLAGQKL